MSTRATAPISILGRLGGPSILNGFCIDGSAVSAIEFALVAPLLVILIAETMQVGLYFYTSAAVKAATSSAARQIMTGAVASAGLTADQFRKQILCPRLPGALSCANVVVNIQTVAEDISPNGFYALLNADQTGIAMPAMDNGKTSFCPGQGGSYVAIEVYYAMPVMSPIWTASATSWNGSNVHFVSAATAFKNEPFQPTNPDAC